MQDHWRRGAFLGRRKCEKKISGKKFQLDHLHGPATNFLGILIEDERTSSNLGGARAKKPVFALATIASTVFGESRRAQAGNEQGLSTTA